MKRSLATLLLLASTMPGLAAGDGELGGTNWRLVQIQSMDDSVLAPDDRSKYRLEFRPDGTAALLADCNRANGSWTSDADSQLRFGPIAATRAMCPPGSLSDRYLAQFEAVRSYVMKDGHLFLATMADGAIIEFEPASDSRAAATVLGEELRGSDAREVQETILSRLFDRFASERGIEATPVEIEAFLTQLHRGKEQAGLTAEEDLTPAEAAELATMENAMAAGMIRQWKINKALYEEYGGRIIYQQLGPEPLDAYRKFLRERERDGAFAINDPVLAEGFWNYFTNEDRHVFMAPGGDDAVKAFTTPPWERKS